MKNIEVFKAFVLHLADGSIRVFKTGFHEVEEAIANHWYVLAHSRPVQELEAAAVEAVTEEVKHTVAPALQGAVADTVETIVDDVKKAAARKSKAQK